MSNITWSNSECSIVHISFSIWLFAVSLQPSLRVISLTRSWCGVSHELLVFTGISGLGWQQTLHHPQLNRNVVDLWKGTAPMHMCYTCSGAEELDAVDLPLVHAKNMHAGYVLARSFYLHPTSSPVCTYYLSLWVFFYQSPCKYFACLNVKPGNCFCPV